MTARALMELVTWRVAAAVREAVEDGEVTSAAAARIGEAVSGAWENGLGTTLREGVRGRRSAAAAQARVAWPEFFDAP